VEPNDERRSEKKPFKYFLNIYIHLLIMEKKIRLSEKCVDNNYKFYKNLSSFFGAPLIIRTNLNFACLSQHGGSIVSIDGPA